MTSAEVAAKFKSIILNLIYILLGVGEEPAKIWDKMK